jgi:hypothetical protein
LAQVLLVKPILFLSKVPMVYGTMISNAIVLGAIVSVSAMLSGSGSQARAVRLRPRLGRSRDLAVYRGVVRVVCTARRNRAG